jgi:membrane associated rhomboid family serine protease
MESEKRALVLQASFYGGLTLLAVLVMVCGLGMAFGSRTASVFGFFGALAMLGVLSLLVWKIRSGVNRERDPEPRG